MSRDNTLPFSKPLSKVAPILPHPVWTAITSSDRGGAFIITLGRYLRHRGYRRINLSYFLCNHAILRALLGRLAQDHRAVQARAGPGGSHVG